MRAYSSQLKNFIFFALLLSSFHQETATSRSRGRLQGQSKLDNIYYIQSIDRRFARARHRAHRETPVMGLLARIYERLNVYIWALAHTGVDSPQIPIRFEPHTNARFASEFGYRLLYNFYMHGCATDRGYEWLCFVNYSSGCDFFFSFCQPIMGAHCLTLGWGGYTRLHIILVDLKSEMIRTTAMETDELLRWRVYPSENYWYGGLVLWMWGEFLAL